MIKHIRVLGLGKVGELVASMLGEAGFTVVGYDQDHRTSSGPYETARMDIRDTKSLRGALEGADAVVSCLPYFMNSRVAECASDSRVHYFDLTEDVPTTEGIRLLAERAPDLVFAPQCGLAPGLIGIVGASLIQQLHDVRSIELKVGALPEFPTGQLGYAFNWSPDGVINEYLNDCEVLRGGVRQMVPALTEVERVLIGGVELEAALTSGGLGTMCQTYQGGTVQRLDYKSMRYPGHFVGMRLLFDELGLRRDRDLASKLLVAAKPPVDDDIVFLHAAVEGRQPGSSDTAAALVRKEYVRAYRPMTIAGRRWRAISWTTAAAVAATVELVAAGRTCRAGFLRQEDIALDALLDTHSGERLNTGQP